MSSKTKNSKLLVFFTTFSNKEDAHKFANLIVSKELASCVNLIDGISSHYKWKGKLQIDSEVLAIGKTTSVKFKKLKGQLKKLHPYDLPELIALPIVDGFTPYLKWLKS